MPIKYTIIDDIENDLYDEYDDIPRADIGAAMSRNVTFNAKVFKDESGYKVALAQGDETPYEWDDGATAATRAGAQELKEAMLSVLNSEREKKARIRALRAERAQGKAQWIEKSRKQLAADQLQLNKAAGLSLEIGDTVILKGYDIDSLGRRRGAAKWAAMRLTEKGLTGWSRFGYTSQADAVMYERDEAPGRMVVVKDGKVQQVRAGKPKTAA